jgi:hypothetical protein
VAEAPATEEAGRIACDRNEEEECFSTCGHQPTSHACQEARSSIPTTPRSRGWRMVSAVLPPISNHALALPASGVYQEEVSITLSAAR